MITLIAESKTMSSRQIEISREEYLAHTPAAERQADEIIAGLSALSPEELSERLGLSASMARTAQKLIYEFPDKSHGYQAMQGFTGVVFKSFGSDTLSPEALDFTRRHVIIASSLYGLLRPADIIKPYRLDYKASGAPGDMTMQRFWKQWNTISLVKHLKEHNEHEILNLMPADASKCFDWKVIRSFCKVYIVQMQEPDGPESTRTPRANRLKQLRGLLLREIADKRIDSTESLRSIESPHFVFAGELPYPGYLTFLC